MTWHVHSTLNSPLYPGGAKTAKASERKLLAQQWAFRISGVLDRTKIDEEARQLGEGFGLIVVFDVGQ